MSPVWYVWEYTGWLQKATCPNCSAKVPVDNDRIDDSLEAIADEYDLTVVELEEVLRRVRTDNQ